MTGVQTCALPILSQNLAKTLQVLIYDNFFCFRAEIGRLQTQHVGKSKNHESEFVKIFLVKNAYVGEEGTLSAPSMARLEFRLRYDHTWIAKSHLRKNKTLQKTLKLYDLFCVCESNET